MPLPALPFEYPAIEWPAPVGVQAFYTSRRGVHNAHGALTFDAVQTCAPSAARGAYSYGAFNLGDHVGDAQDQVSENRQTMARVLGAPPIFLQQVHGVRCIELPCADAPLLADAVWTRAAKTPCTILVADCLPILFCDARGSSVGALHAGWRGLVGGVIEAFLRDFAPLAGGEIFAWMGPCIGTEAFEVDAPVRNAFISRYDFARDYFQKTAECGKYHLDLAGLARRVLEATGVRAFGNNGGAMWCTVRQSQSWYSHRYAAQSRQSAGRMAAGIYLTEKS